MMNEPPNSSNSTPSTKTDRFAEWMYQGFWLILVNIFKVPDEPPTLPASQDGQPPLTFKPDKGYLRYLRFFFWFFLVLIDISILVGWLILLITVPILGIILAIPALLIAVVPDIITYIALHLKYDTTWYVISDRSLRIRRGIWLIHETTITFENVQNITISQGPVQRYFGISDLIIDTAGGGGGGSHGSDASGNSIMNANRGIMAGLADAESLRDLMMQKLRAVRSAGLGDDVPTHKQNAATSHHTINNQLITSPQWTQKHLTTLREIKQALNQLSTTHPQSDPR